MRHRGVLKLIAGFIMGLSLIAQMLPAGSALAQDAITGPNTVFLPLVTSSGSSVTEPNEPAPLPKFGSMLGAAAVDDIPEIGMPDADTTSGKFLNVTRGLASLGDTGAAQNAINISIAVLPELDRFSIVIFDGDMGGKWDRLPIGIPDQLTFKLYSDPDLIGNTDPADLIHSWPAPAMPDNDWCTLTPPGSPTACQAGAELEQNAAAYNAAEDTYFYHLVADWNSTLNNDEQNVFKVKVRGMPFFRGDIFAPAGSTVGLEGFNVDLTVAGFPKTNYDGRFHLHILVPENQDHLELFDGDFDLTPDTDDPNSPNCDPQVPSCGFPPFQVSPYTLSEGVRRGDPPDDQPTAFFRFPPDVYYTVTPPDASWTVTNSNVSGNQEWEVFRVGLQGAGIPDVDGEAPSLPPGIYDWELEGVDALNTLFIHSEYDMFPALVGQIGNTVWRDNNNDGFWQQATEPGIAGVIVNLWQDVDENGILDKNVDQYAGSKTTDANGQYVFSDLELGYYLVEVDPGNFAAGKPLNSLEQTADRSTFSGDHANRTTPWPVFINTNAGYWFADFGYRSAGGSTTYNLGDFVWHDANANGLQDTDEPGIGGVALTLLGDPADPGIPGGSFSLNTTTLPDGSYAFVDLVAGDYRVSVDPSNFLPGGALAGYLPTYSLVGPDRGDDSNGSPASTTLNASKESDLTLDFGYVSTAAVGNYVWIDENDDGYQDAGEPGIGGVVVQLLDANGQVVATRTTDSAGGYLFKNVFPGAYTVQVDATTLPNGLRRSTHPVLAGADFGNQSLPYAVTLAQGDENLTADFGYIWGKPNENEDLGALGDRVWIDTDGDGVQDPGEIGIGGIQVSLYYDSNGDGKVQPAVDAKYTPAVDQNGATGSGTTTTGPDGTYIFHQLPAGIYKVVVDNPPADYVQTGDPDHFGAPAASASPGAAGDNRTTSPVVLGPGDVFLNADFGYQPTTAPKWQIGDTIFLDSNANGAENLGEPGIPGVTVTLLDAAGNSVGTTTTDAAGKYLFSGLPSGQYTVVVNDTDHVLAELVPSADPDFPGVPCAGACDNRSTKTLGPNDLTRDFGYTPAGHKTSLGLIGDTIFVDADPTDGNTFKLGVDQPIEGVVVKLYDASGTILLATTTTNENGNYYFGGLNRQGVYQVVVDTTTLPTGLTTNTVDPDGGADSRSRVDLNVTGPIDLEQDFGYTPQQGQAGSIGNLVWEDLNADGNVDAGEAGIPGVTVDLYYDADGDGKVGVGEPKIGSATTDASGGYLFSQLPAGKYVVDVSDSAGVLAGYWHSLGNQAPGSDNESKVDPHAVTLAAGQNYVAADFGYYVDLASLGNRVWQDSNGNGKQDAGEPNLAGVDVKLVVGYPDGSQTTLVFTTDADGFYNFRNLLADEDYNGDGAGPEPTHTLTVATPAGLAPTIIGAAGTTAKDDSNNPAGTAAQPVQGQTDVSAKASPNNETNAASYDFGFRTANTGSIGNYVWVDENSDGYQDAGEPGIPNVQVNLYGASGNLVATTRTDAQGGYLFPNLAAGTYYVDVLDGTGGQASTLPVAGMTQTPYNLTGVDFGNQDHSTTTIPSTSFKGYQVVLAAGQENLTADFGYNYNPTVCVDNPADAGCTDPTATIGDRVWVDTDGDGVQDPNEVGIPGVEVKLYTAGPDGLFGTPDDVVAGTTTTNNTGYYIFDGLTPGAYVVVVTPPPGYTQTGDPDHFGVTDVSPANNDNKTTTPVVLGPGDVFLNADFGYQPPAAQNNSVGDRVWFDVDADGVQDAGEPGIPGVTVALIKDSDGDGAWDAGEPIIGTTTTVADGFYQFSGLPDGKYLVWVNDTDNVLAGKTQTFDSDGIATPNISKVDLDAGGANPNPVSNQDQDFGYTAPGQEPGKGLIGDTVFLDRDANNLPGAGEGIEGVTVRLYDSTGTTVLATTVTDENGNYWFGGLNPIGSYQVKVDTTTLPAGLTNTFDPDGTLDSQSAPNLGAPGNDGVNDPDGVDNGINLGQDFGYRPSNGSAGSIGNLVWKDANADGVSDPDGADNTLGTDDDEPGLAGVTLDLYYDKNGNGKVDAGEPKVASTTTAAGGAYLFSNLPTADNGAGAAGADYVVDVTDVNGVLAGYWHSLGTPKADNNSQVDPYAASISAATPNNLTADFGYYVEPAAIGNFVWGDLNGNGLQEAGEPGIAGATVKLTITYPNGTQRTVTTTTAANGFYSFGNLLLDEDYRLGSSTGTPGANQPAHVVLSVTPAGYLPTLVEQGANRKVDSNNHAGTPAQPVQGLTDVSAKADPNAEQMIASYDFGYRPPVCGLSVAKTCVAPAPVSTAFVCSDAKPIDELSMIWNGTQNVRIKAYKGAVGSTLLADIDNIAPGQEVTVKGFAGSPNDVIWEIFNAGTSTKIGQSDFHLSCSDADMNGPEDCGKVAGDAKGLTGFINTWKFEGMGGNGQVLNCTAAPQPGVEQCEISLADAPSCETVGKPTSLTFQYTGGGCSATNNPQGGKATCSGSINPLQAVVVSAGGTGYSVSPTTVAPGGTFVVSRSSFDTNTYLTLTQGANKEQLAIHTSCSQELEVGNIFGSLTLVGFNGQSDKSPITYNYVVSNQGDALTNVTLTDDKLGHIAGQSFSLAVGETKTFTKVADIFQTTTNVATVSGVPASGAQACQATDSVTVVVQEPCLVCKGGTVDLTLQYIGASGANVTIYDDPGAKADKILFQGTVQPGGEITLKPRPGQSKLNNEISVWIGGVLQVKIKTDCSQPIGPEAIYGDFKITEAFGKDNGRMCPLNACEAAVDTTLAIKDKEVKWKVTNNGEMPLVIERISITWPAANGALDEIKRDGDVVHKGDFSAPSATITSGWDGDAGKRTVDIGQTDELKFKFKNNAATNAEYKITVDFDQGCSVSIEYKGGTGGGQSFTCSKPIDALTMQWDGAQANVRVTAWKGTVGTGTPLANLAPVAKGSNLTVSGFAGSPNDVIWEVYDAAGTTKLGESTFHLSCSDADMNSADDCNKRQGDGKRALTGYLNDWVLKGMVDSDETLVCGP